MDQDGQPVPDAAVMIWPDAGTAPAPKQASIAQQDYEFSPATSIVSVGSNVAFPNRDTSRHHIYSFSPAKQFEIKLYVGLPESPIRFDKPGVVTLGCNIHDWMYGVLYVTDAPVYGLTDQRGAVALEVPPDRTYRLEIWHPRLPEAHRIDAAAGETQHQIALRLDPPVPRPAKPADPENSLIEFVRDRD